MFGAIIGDFIGSTYEFHPIYSRYFDLFNTHNTLTDDSVLTAALSEALIHDEDIADTLVKWTMRYKNAGYGSHYFKWAFLAHSQSERAQNPIEGTGYHAQEHKDSLPQSPGTSWGNGCLMRNSPVILLSSDMTTALDIATEHCILTHSQADALEATQQYTQAVFSLLEFSKHQFYDPSYKRKLPPTLQKERREHFFNKVSELGLVFDSLDNYCMTGFHVDAKSTLKRVLSVLQDSNTFEEAMRNCVYIGGDCDTNAAIAGAAAELLYGLDEDIMKNFLAYAQTSGSNAQDILSLVARSYLKSPHRQYFFESKPYYLDIVQKIVQTQNTNV